MTQRVRVHVTLPDLGSQQVWLLADLSASSKIINVKSAFSDQLGLERDPSGLELAVDGFALLDRSSASIVNPVDDVLQLRLKASTSATSVHAKQVKPVQAEDSDQHAAKKRRVQAQVKQSTPKPNTAEKAVSPPKSNADTDLEIAKRALLAEYVGTATPHSASSASSSSSVSSSSASSSDSDSDSDSSATFEPKRIPSHTTQRQSSAAISQRRRSTSGSSSEPSSSADTSSSDDSNDPPPTAQKQFPLRSADTTGNASHDVPPGAGQAKTKARNQRKRKRRLLLKAAERSVADAKTGVPLPAVADQPAHPPGQIPVNAQAATPRPVKAVAAAAATPSTIVDTARGLVETVTEQSELHKGMTSAAALSSNKNKAKSLKRDRAKGLRQHGTKLVFNATGNVEGTPVVSQATIQYADMSNAHVGAPLRVATPAKDPAEYENYTPQSPRHDNDVDETADMDLEKDDSAASATYTAHPTPQRAVIGPSVTPAAKVAIAKSAPRSLPRQVPMQPAPPSMRRHQMPSNVLVTSTDVERDDFVPGQPQPDFQISSKALAYYKESLQASSTQNDASSLLSNISQPAIGPAVPVVGPIASKPAAKAPITTVQWHASASSTVQASGSIYSGTTSSKSGAQLSDTIDWTGWPTSVSEVMRKFTTYTQISNAPGEGECVAMRTLELSSDTYSPEIAHIYGVVLSMGSTPHKSTVTLKLHPACRPQTAQHSDAEDDEYAHAYEQDEQFWEDAETQVSQNNTQTRSMPRRRLGEDSIGLVDPAADTSIKVIEVLEIVETRRLPLHT